MSEYTTVGTRCGDISISNVYCDNIRAYNGDSNGDYKLVLVFGDKSGANGMLVNAIRKLRNDVPSYIVQTCADHTISTAYLSGHYPVRLSRSQTLTFGNNVAQLRIGTHKLGDIIQHNPVLRCVASVTFKNVHVAEEQCGGVVTNAILHCGIEVDSIFGIEAIQWFPGIPQDESIAL